MQLAIPHAPRPVRLTQVPGAVMRLSLAAAVGVGLCILAGGIALRATGYFSAERAFLGRAQRVEGTVIRVELPPLERRVGEDAILTAIYEFDRLQRSATGIRMAAERAEGLGPGAKIALLVDPADPEHPREEESARRRGGMLWLLPLGLGLGLAIAAACFVFELRRVYRSLVEPLRTGALVWLTPAKPLSDSKREVVFDASYFRDGVKHEVRARGRPGRAPVRNGEKVLAAVVPRRPTWVRVVDEDLAHTLGWMR
ncbi:MAG: DUF3592 domain-containing protein [Myxococcaceae bacterium]|nr:DUF3592 domain-containing protein [Myxococcaceae bacterium]